MIELVSIQSYLPESEILQQLAEECCELAQAALKLKRIEDGVNPTPVSEDYARDNLYEEIADVKNCICALELSREDNEKILDIMAAKNARWAKRLSKTI